MSLTVQHQKELLQRAYISAIAATAGVNVHINKAEFDYGIDGHFSMIRQTDSGDLFEDGKLEFQMKASTEVTVRKKYITYKLDAKTHRKLIQRACEPAMLILLVLPKEQDQWLTLNQDAMIVQKCCYWHFLVGESPTKNSSKKTIHFPIDNVLTPKTVIDFLEEFQKVKSSNEERYRQLLLGSGGVQ